MLQGQMAEAATAWGKLGASDDTVALSVLDNKRALALVGCCLNKIG